MNLGPTRSKSQRTTSSRACVRAAGWVKALLLNQEFLRGLGNIYVDEALFRARIHPKANTAQDRPPPCDATV